MSYILSNNVSHVIKLRRAGTDMISKSNSSHIKQYFGHSTTASYRHFVTAYSVVTGKYSSR